MNELTNTRKAAASTEEPSNAGSRATGQQIAGAVPFDGTYGYELDDLLAISAPAAPEDFHSFWRELYTRARQVDVAPDVRCLQTTIDRTRIYSVTYRSIDGLRLGGWLTIPDEPIERGLVVGHGYAGRAGPDLPLPVPGAAAIFPCARGLGARSRLTGIPDEPAQHVLHGIESRNTYVHGGCVADLWCATTALLELVPFASGNLGYSGTSFGGGIGALAMPWDDRFTVAHLALPSFGHHPLRLTHPCTGSGEAVRRHHLAHPETRRVLRYFDSATAATQIKIPTQVAAARFDPAVPPPGQFAVYNALAGARDLVILSAGHVENATTSAEQRWLFAAQSAFLTRHLTRHDYIDKNCER